VADRVYSMIEMMFYIANSCYFDLSVQAVEGMMACWVFTILSHMAILLVVWFTTMWGMKYPDPLDVCQVAMLHHRLVCDLNLAIRVIVFVDGLGWTLEYLLGRLPGGRLHGGGIIGVGKTGWRGGLR